MFPSHIWATGETVIVTLKCCLKLQFGPLVSLPSNFQILVQYRNNVVNEIWWNIRPLLFVQYTLRQPSVWNLKSWKIRNLDNNLFSFVWEKESKNNNKKTNKCTVSYTVYNQYSEFSPELDKTGYQKLSRYQSPISLCLSWPFEHATKDSIKTYENPQNWNFSVIT